MPSKNSTTRKRSRSFKLDETWRDVKYIPPSRIVRFACHITAAEAKKQFGRFSGKGRALDVDEIQVLIFIDRKKGGRKR